MTAWKESGQPIARFAKERGLSVGRMYYWRDVFARETPVRKQPRKVERPPTARPKLLPVTVRQEKRAAAVVSLVHDDSPREIDPVWAAKFARALFGVAEQ